MRFLTAALIRIYRTLISPLLGARCRFYPSCSEYALAAFGEYRWWRACLLSAKRICKCHPWHPGGVDMLPGKRKGIVL